MKLEVMRLIIQVTVVDEMCQMRLESVKLES